MEVLKLPESDEDADREARIDELHRKLCNARTPQEQRRHMMDMEEEIKARSPRQVARMERAKGLR